jgi:hypothetical protein
MTDLAKPVSRPWRRFLRFSVRGMIAGLTNLSQVYLYCTQVSDTGLAQMKGLTKLSELDLLGTNVTDAGVADLQQASPTRLRIIR